MFDSKDSKAATLFSSAETYSGEVGVRFQSSARNSHLTPAVEQLRQGVVREHLIYRKSISAGRNIQILE